MKHGQAAMMGYLREQYPHIDLVNELQGLLHLCSSAIYKRLNGTVPLTLDEFMIITSHFDISVDEMVGRQSDFLKFQFSPLKNPVGSFSEFLRPIASELKRISKFEGNKIWYSTHEIPFFHQFIFPELTAFKFFIYSKTIWNIPVLTKKKFSLKDRSFLKHLNEFGSGMLDDYYSIPSVEIWTKDILDNTLNQIRYYVSCGSFTDQRDVDIVLRRVNQLVDHLEEMVAMGKKKKPFSNLAKGSYEVMINEISFANNTFLVSSQDGYAVYLTFDNPNFMMSHDQDFGNYTQLWFEKLESRSFGISRAGEEQRMKYFALLRKKIQNVKNHLEAKVALGE